MTEQPLWQRQRAARAGQDTADEDQAGGKPFGWTAEDDARLVGLPVRRLPCSSTWTPETSDAWGRPGAEPAWYREGFHREVVRQIQAASPAEADPLAARVARLEAVVAVLVRAGTLTVGQWAALRALGWPEMEP